MTEREKQIAEMTKEIVNAGVGFAIAEYGNETNYRLNCRAIAQLFYDNGYRLCGGDSCSNYKHYKAECENCTKVMEIKQACIVESAKKYAVKEAFEKLKEELSLGQPLDDFEKVNEQIDELFTELYGADE